MFSFHSRGTLPHVCMVHTHAQHLHTWACIPTTHILIKHASSFSIEQSDAEDRLPHVVVDFVDFRELWNV